MARRGFDRINDKSLERCRHPITPSSIVDYLYCPHRALLAITNNNKPVFLSNEGLLIANTIKSCYSIWLKQGKLPSWKQVLQRLNIEISKNPMGEKGILTSSELSKTTGYLTKLQAWYGEIFPYNTSPFYVGVPINELVGDSLVYEDNIDLFDPETNSIYDFGETGLAVPVNPYQIENDFLVLVRCWGFCLALGRLPKSYKRLVIRPQLIKLIEVSIDKIAFDKQANMLHYLLQGMNMRLFPSVVDGRCNSCRVALQCDKKGFDIVKNR